MAHPSSAVILTLNLRVIPGDEEPKGRLQPAGHPPSEMSPPPVPRRGAETAEPALTESDDRLHLQHGVSQARVPPLDQALLVRHRPVQTLLPVLGDNELRPVVGNDAAFAAGEGPLWGESKDRWGRAQVSVEEGSKLLNEPFLEDSHGKGRVLMTS